MRTIRKNFKLPAAVLALSIAAMPSLVNGQGQSLSTINPDRTSNTADLKDSISARKTGMERLIATLLTSGVDSRILGTLAPVIGLATAMPMKKREVTVSATGDAESDVRACYVIYENAESAAPERGDKRVVCAYIVKIKRSGLDMQNRYFKINLNGKLEKAVLTQSKYDEAGKIIRGSGVKFDQDIESPEVKKTFEAELKFWLKDWLKKEQKNAAKKTATAATPPAAAPL